MAADKGQKIGIIGGAGWLGGAVAVAMLDAGVVTPENLSLSYRSQRHNRFPKAFWTSDNQTLADRSDVIVLSVRPADWHGLKLNAQGKLVISVMAGIRLEALCERHQTKRMVRALPNAAAQVRRSYTPWIGTADIDHADTAVVQSIFDACGVQDQVHLESQIDYMTGLTGSGPAFPALFAQAMMADAIAHGLEPQIALRAVNTLIIGAGRLLEQRGDDPRDIVRDFLDYRGTTAAAIEEMQNAGLDAAVSRGLMAAFQKSVSMGGDS